jgi:hypothetical protein
MLTLHDDGFYTQSYQVGADPPWSRLASGSSKAESSSSSGIFPLPVT